MPVLPLLTAGKAASEVWNDLLVQLGNPDLSVPSDTFSSWHSQPLSTLLLLLVLFQSLLWTVSPLFGCLWRLQCSLLWTLTPSSCYVLLGQFHSQIPILFLLWNFKTVRNTRFLQIMDNNHSCKWNLYSPTHVTCIFLSHPYHWSVVSPSCNTLSNGTSICHVLRLMFLQTGMCRRGFCIGIFGFLLKTQ